MLVHFNFVLYLIQTKAINFLLDFIRFSMKLINYIFGKCKTTFMVVQIKLHMVILSYSLSLCKYQKYIISPLVS